MNIKEIVEKYLKDNGYDGLWNQDDECGCTFDDLFECAGNCDPNNCEPGYKHPGNEEYDYLIGPDKPETKSEKEDEI